MSPPGDRFSRAATHTRWYSLDAGVESRSRSGSAPHRAPECDVLYEDYKFTRQYLETQYATAVQGTQEATTNYNVAVNERDTASKADQPKYDDKVASASQQLDYAKDTERAASNDLTQLKIDPALRDNAKQYEAEKAGQDPSKEWYTKHDNDAKPDQPGALHNFAMQAGVVGVMGMQALTSAPSGHAIESEMRESMLLTAKVESQFQGGSQQPGSQQQQQPAGDQKGPEAPGPGKEGTGKPAEQRAPEQHPQGSQQQQQHGDQKGPEAPGAGKEGTEKPTDPHHQGSQQQQHHEQHHEQHHDQHQGGDQKGHETPAAGKEGTDKPAEQHVPPPTEQVTAGPSEKEIKQEEKEHQKDERSEQAAENVEQLHHGLEKAEDSPEGGKTSIHSGSATFGAPGYPDPERSSAMAASLQSPQGEAHQTAPAKGGAEIPPTERPVEVQAKGEAQFGAQAHPDPERSAAAAMQSGEPKGQAHEATAQGQGQPNQSPEPKGQAQQTAAVQGHAEFGGQGQSSQSQAQPDHQPHQTEAKGEASFGAHNYPNPEREQQMATSLNPPGGGGGQGAAEHSSATYNVSNGAQPREMPPTEHSASQIANTQPPPPQQQPDPNHGH
jgi:hypothetical protein